MFYSFWIYIFKGKGQFVENFMLTTPKSQSASTSQKYYQQVKGDDHAVKAFKTMEDLRGPSPPSPTLAGNGEERDEEALPKPIGIRFSNEETKAIQQYFDLSIKAGKSTKLPDCRLSIKSTPFLSKRTPNQVQDKVTWFIRNGEGS